MTPRAPASRRRPLPYLILGGVIALLLVAWGITSVFSDDRHGPVTSALPDETRMGPVELLTADLGPMRDYYVDAVGLSILEEADDMVSLGGDGGEVLVLREVADHSLADVATAGLYHSALLYPDEAALANVLVSIATVAPESFSGSADHAVSLAFYFTDPDGNGLELYADTPREEWVWRDGLVQMGSALLDPNQFMQDHYTGAAADEITMGHVHLRVGDLAQAREFYEGVLGFAVTAESEGALFYAAGGYHHHLATNVWQSAGAGARGDVLGLGHLSVDLGGEEALDEARARLEQHDVAFTRTEAGITVVDPWGNTVILS